MRPISKADMEQSVQQTPSAHGSSENQFSETLMLAKADALLRKTSQYATWTDLCQNIR